MRIGDRTLPVRRFKERIIDKIKFNRVTLICGFTGSGILPSALSLFLFLSNFLSLLSFLSLLVSFSTSL
jgi:HrpA-like RNA helicase